MSEGGRTVALGELVSNFDARRIPLSRRVRSERPGPYPYYGATGVMDHVDDYLFEGLHLLVAEDGSVEAPTGTPFLQLVDGQFWVNNHAHVLRGATDEDTRYLYYALSTVQVRPFMSGSVQAKLSQRNLNQIPVPYPAQESERRAIGRVLGTLDDKIELNRRVSATLEAMARALFKSWFVDFEPVRAKAAGRPSGLPPALDALFPASFEASELGEIPSGWGVGTLGDVAVERRRGVKPQDMVPGTPYIGLEHMPRRSIALSEWGTTDGLASSKSRFDHGDILFGKLRPYFHKVGVAPLDGVCSTDIVVLAPMTDDWFGFVLGHASSDDFVDYTDAGSTGTRMPRTKWKDMTRYRIPLPDRALAAAFGERVHPLVVRIASAIRDSRARAEQRDALLPRLVSGEVRVGSDRDLRSHTV